MERRLHMDSTDKKLMVEQEPTLEGKAWLIDRRLFDKRFKGVRIKEILQAYPSDIPLGVVIERK